MKQETANSKQETAKVRGTQSFVGVMAAVWKRPSLTGLEVLWRWLIGGLLFLSAGWATRIQSVVINDNTYLLRNLSVLRPASSVQDLYLVAAAILAGTMPILRWFVPVAAVSWLLASAAGRTIVLQRYNPMLRARATTLFVLGAFRAFVLLAVWVLWGWSVVRFTQLAILGPDSRNEEPNLVLFSAMLICGSLLFFVLWAAASWFLQLAPMVAMLRDLGPLESLGVALGSDRRLRSKLIETNLVMNIVKIALIVLTMVFSACPLPFESVETQQFLTCWWIGVGVLYLIASDYFHVVRAAAYVALYRVYEEA